MAPSDFTSEPGTDIELSEVVRDPHFTLYCIDVENQSALFVESCDPVATDRAPFYYQGQIENAVGLVSMSLEEFHMAAAAIPPPAKNVIFVHSVGRCGSTLLSKILQAVPTVHSLSEPDDLTQIASLRTAQTYSDQVLHSLIESSVRWRCKERSGSRADFVAIKPRSEVMVLGDLIGASLPRARHFFLYRNALTWMRTIYRCFSTDRDIYDDDRNRDMELGWSRMVPLIRDLRDEAAPKNPIQIRILSWASCMEAYLDLLEMNVPLCAARFEDLTADPVSTLQQFFDFSEIDGVDWSEIQRVLDRDSLAGTIYDRKERSKQSRELTAELTQDVFGTLAARPRLLKPDVRLPGTITLDRVAPIQ